MSRPDQGVGYYQFRPLELVGATMGADGAFVGGKIVPVSNERLIDEGRYSLEQFFGPKSQVRPGDTVNPNLWKTAYRNTSVFNYLAMNLRAAGTKIQAESDFKNKVDQLCGDIQERVKNYENVRQAGISMSQHPATLIQDIFGAADPSWEKFSTPGGDSRMREFVRDIVNDAITTYRTAKSGSKVILFSGSAQDYVTKLRQILAQTNATCKIAYTNSAGQRVGLTLNDVTRRLNRMSFDPYMCIEKAWGATGNEMQSCRDNDKGNRWYNAEQYLRNVVGKVDEDGNSTIRSDREITLGMLQDTSLLDQPSTSAVNLGSAKAPLMNLDAILASEAFIKRLQQ
jgi:hypothetical protein